MTAWVRSSFGLSYSLSSRYKIYSTLMIVFCYQYIVDRTAGRGGLSKRAKRTLYGGTLVGAVLFSLASDAAGLKLLKTRKAEAIAGLGWYLAAPQTHSPFPEHMGIPNPSHDADPVAIEARQSLTESLASGIYVLPSKEVAEARAKNRCVCR
jgi:hypothetical protein